jgi:hypothetical protein
MTSSFVDALLSAVGNDAAWAIVATEIPLVLILSGQGLAQVPCRPDSDPSSCGEDKIKVSVSQDRVEDTRQKALFTLTYGLLTQIQLAGWTGRLSIVLERVSLDQVEVSVGPDMKRTVRRGDVFSFTPKTQTDLQAFGKSPILVRVEP